MKILHLIQKPQLRGAEIFASQLASHINKNGHEAIIVPLFPGEAALPFDGKIILLEGNANKRQRDWKGWKKLANIIKKEQPHIIQANAGDTLRYAVLSKLLFRWKQPIVFRNASTMSLYIKSTWAKKWYGWLFNFVDKIISVSNTSALDFATLFPQHKNKITTIPIGIDDIRPDNAAKMLTENKSNTAPSGNPVLLHVGGFTFEKNHTGLINIFEKILKTLPEAELHLVGDGPQKSKIEILVTEKRLSGKVHFHGFKKNALDYIQNAQVLLLPSIIEGLPGVILEAFYCKTPVVAYNTGGIKEIVINNETGRLIENGNEEAFAEAVLQALQNTPQDKLMIENAYQLVMKQYTNSAVTKNFLGAYEMTLS